VETKTADLKEMKAMLAELAAKIDELDAKVHRRHSEVESHMQQIETLQAKHMTAHQMLEQCQKAAHDEWTTLKSGYEELVKDIQEVLVKVAASY